MRAAVLICGLLTSVAAGQSLFEVGTERTQRVIVTIGAEAPELASKGGPLESDMTRALKGVLADVHGKAIDELRGCFPANPMLGDPAGGEHLCTLHLSSGPTSAVLEIVRGKDGSIIAIEQGTSAHPRRAELRRERFEAEYASLPQYRGGFDKAGPEPRGPVFQLSKAYVAVAAKIACLAYALIRFGAEYRCFPEAAVPSGRTRSARAVEAMPTS